MVLFFSVFSVVKSIHSLSAVPLSLGLQDDLDDLADSASSPRRPGDQVGRALDLGHGVGGASRQAYSQEDRQVRQVVAHETDLAR